MADEPVLRVVRGTPTAEEIAALVGAIFTRRPAPAPAPRPARSAWRRSGFAGVPPHGGPGAWRASGLPTA